MGIDIESRGSSFGGHAYPKGYGTPPFEVYLHGKARDTAWHRVSYALGRSFPERRRGIFRPTPSTSRHNGLRPANWRSEARRGGKEVVPEVWIAVGAEHLTKKNQTDYPA